MRVTTLIILSALGAGSVNAQDVRQAPANAPSQIAITRAAEAGAKLTVSGRVIGANGRPVSNASLYVYQTDANGEYVPNANGGGSDRPRLFAYLRSDKDGRYSFSTIRPGSYPTTRNPGHIHFEVTAAGHATRVYEIVFENDPYVSAGFREQAKDPYGGVAIVETRPASGGAFTVAHDVNLRPAGR